MKKDNVKINIMKREFVVSCSDEESQNLVEAAAYLEEQMCAVSKSPRILGAERCAIMAGLNISSELLALRNKVNDEKAINARLENLHRKLDDMVVDITQTK